MTSKSRDVPGSGLFTTGKDVHCDESSRCSRMSKACTNNRVYMETACLCIVFGA